MHHVAVMNKSWHLLPKILSGQKIIESRWYTHRCEAWNSVRAGDTVFFKNSGAQVTVRARVKRVMQFYALTPAKVKTILMRYGSGIGYESFASIYRWAKCKTYCVLVFLEQAQATKPFSIDKAGFGSAAAWVSVRNIKEIKIA